MLLNEPRVIQAHENNDLCLGTMDSWLIYQLTDGKSFKTEPSNACRTQLMNIRTGNWDKNLSEIFGVDLESLPQIVDSNGHFGNTNLFGLLPHPIPILSVLGDSQAALFAHGCFKAGDFKVNNNFYANAGVNLGFNKSSSKSNSHSESGVVTTIKGKDENSSITYNNVKNIEYVGTQAKDTKFIYNNVDNVAKKLLN